MAGPAHVRPVLPLLMRTLARCVGSTHFQVSRGTGAAASLPPAHSQPSIPHAGGRARALPLELRGAHQRRHPLARVRRRGAFDRGFL